MADNVERVVIDKIKTQWKTIRKAFCDMNKEKGGHITEQEFKFYLNHWSLNLSPEQFRVIFDRLDYDGDGKISYDDFHKSIGGEIHPGENLYFR